MTVKLLILNVTDSPLPLGEGLGVKSMAGQFLKTAAVSTDKAVDTMKLTKRRIEVTMFNTGAGTLEDLKDGKLIKA